jgi:preprotein translocase subunit SecE|tara:strand:+ start:47 stop:415 length:369 start_codon:yes stop_codon:yes gene_type:complete
LNEGGFEYSNTTFIFTFTNGRSSAGRAVVSKTKGREFDSCRPCKIKYLPMASLGTYIKESYIELITKVTWPVWKTLQQSSVLVFVASLIISLIVWGMDYVFGMNGKDDLWQGIIGMIYNLIS